MHSQGSCSKTGVYKLTLTSPWASHEISCPHVRSRRPRGRLLGGGGRGRVGGRKKRNGREKKFPREKKSWEEILFFFSSLNFSHLLLSFPRPHWLPKSPIMRSVMTDITNNVIRKRTLIYFGINPLGVCIIRIFVFYILATRKL